MAVTYHNFFINTNGSTSDTATISSFIFEGDNKVAIAYMMTISDDTYMHPSHDSMETYLRSFTKFRTDDLGNCRISYWYLIGGDVISFKTLVGTVGSDMPQSRIHIGCHTVTNAYQGTDFIRTSNVRYDTALAEETISSVNGAMMLSFAHTQRLSAYTYATPVPGTGITTRGKSLTLPVINGVQYRIAVYGGSDPITESSVTTSWSSVLVPEQYLMSGIMVMPLGWTKPDWYDLIGEYIEPPCGYVGQVAGSSPDLSHLEGQTVAIYANGTVMDEQVVTDGAVTFPSGLSLIHIGLPFYSDFETLNVEVPDKEGTVQSKRCKINNVMFRLQDSRGGFIGPDEDNLWEAFTADAIRKSSGQNINDDELFTGDIRQPLGAQFGDEGHIFFRQVDPLPISIGAVIPEVEYGGRSR